MGAVPVRPAISLIGSILMIVKCSCTGKEVDRGRLSGGLTQLVSLGTSLTTENGVRSVLFAVSGSQGTRRELPVSRSPVRVHPRGKEI